MAPRSSSSVCKSGTRHLAKTAINQGQNGATKPVPFDITSLNSRNNNFYASATVGGPANATNPSLGMYFDWGLPFFFGRRVANAIHGAKTAAGTGPYVAF